MARHRKTTRLERALRTLRDLWEVARDYPVLAAVVGLALLGQVAPTPDTVPAAPALISYTTTTLAPARAPFIYYVGPQA